jgi:hypothetical protein
VTAPWSQRHSRYRENASFEKYTCAFMSKFLSLCAKMSRLEMSFDETAARILRLLLRRDFDITGKNRKVHIRADLDRKGIRGGRAKSQPARGFDLSGWEDGQNSEREDLLHDPLAYVRFQYRIDRYAGREKADLVRRDECARRTETYRRFDPERDGVAFEIWPVISGSGPSPEEIPPPEKMPGFAAFAVFPERFDCERMRPFCLLS